MTQFAGKVHGSLARAGKVRGQTPKVAKQDKKKKPRGRAHKRMQYNRRFVTAVVGFGKKRGPNSSENLCEETGQSSEPALPGNFSALRILRLYRGQE
ncbi:unnamed protein product [Sphenostylis stenocarpa]|uniref:40S ribosomal protein S30 n=1 Tax=Sphenostylis stenocarpa TaxID=92480 RepID=A0AA86V3T2_9FABA|nr:unnamed protein product [Sphenostylis stenocarpa]